MLQTLRSAATNMELCILRDIMKFYLKNYLISGHSMNGFYNLQVIQIGQKLFLRHFKLE